MPDSLRLLKLAMALCFASFLVSCEMLGGTTTSSSGSNSGPTSVPVVSVSYYGTTTALNSKITLDGTGTTGATSYSWTTLSKPSGSYTYISSSWTNSAYFYPDVSGTYKFQLTASNSYGSASKTLSITVTGPGSIAVTVN